MPVKVSSQTLRVALQNASPISRLPPEILSSIFKWVRGNYSWYPYWHYTWVPAITHVCATWREVALQTPRLWASVFLYPVDWGHEVLRRAKGVPLDIMMRGLPSTDDPIDTDKCISLMKAGFKEPHRVSHIDITFFKRPEEIAKAFSELIGISNMPLLESIYINGDRDAPCRVLDGSFMAPESTPRLTTLISRDCFLDFTAPRFQNLCHLELESNRGPLITDLHAFCVALGEMHDLAKLNMSFVLPRWTEEETIQTLIQTPILLPSLRRVDILQQCDPIPFFKCTRAPKISYAYIWLVSCFDYLDAAANTKEIYKFAAFGSLSGDEHESTEYHLRIVDQDGTLEMDHTEDTGNKKTTKTLSLHFDDSLHSDDFWPFNPPQSPVTSLSVYHEDSPSDELLVYIHALSRTDTVTTLGIPYNLLFNPEVIGVLGRFSALEELFLDSVPEDEESAFQLLICLRRREQQGFPRLKELSVSPLGRDINPHIIAMLKQLVDSFTTSWSVRRTQIDYAARYLGR
ncbi:hypothetical protein ONZ45_g15618 [Pleurotus djamor]|nr:hypothetical protein ONZ45_g15618 [Pleurotus djamor]